ncbi:MAG: hypothetical protein HN742_33600 [Lentisphaerae bacterium]|jgi:hypothetical protein|nr:hypothetical protein [Lentisphaerota bacterium]MBT4820852.1 hypothetical protein [Lentisphaerota bacterium]MBT5611398.1 hypothetical protein [Lentisphaerota bacterium]MBT7059626.1 hypothetical protein [Lentisphaerota bacterium]MBT7846855.1 hypothetical protein [Lentisphaerota bacterium]
MNIYRRTANRVGIALAAGLMVVGGMSVGKRLARYAKRWQREGGGYVSPAAFFEAIPDSKLPGPPRQQEQTFELDDTNSERMIGTDDRENERWCDVAGNFYSAELVSRFTYAGTSDNSPTVRVRVAPVADTFRGRLEAHGLKPNFAYQMKLRGDFLRDREGFDAIGAVGRWRLPGFATNYTDEEIEAYEPKEDIEAYVFFDFVVADAEGRAIREFALDSTLHVLWNGYRQGGPDDTRDLVVVTVDPSSSGTYSRPKSGLAYEFLWAERERDRYTEAGEKIRLPPRTYRAQFVLTEETFHSTDNDGGWWPTVMTLPIAFRIAPPADGLTP